MVEDKDVDIKRDADGKLPCWIRRACVPPPTLHTTKLLKLKNEATKYPMG
ncbi:hypothetical protein [Paenibacillus tyrfis]|nr:hypothetical protein [Paenibacillus tyrfis]MCP1307665.1 hypothetical protein [Paenibacillus tyrfis]